MKKSIMMNGHPLIAGVISLASVILIVTLAAHADKQDCLDYANDRPAFDRHETWAIFMGTGWTKESLKQIEEWERQGKWINPVTEQPFDKKIKVFVFGQNNPALEALRAFSDHFEIHALSSWEELKGYLMCNSF
jgi:hypothetical protein